MGTTALRVVQWGRESTWGTGVAAAVIGSGISDFNFNHGVNINRKKFLAGSLQPAQVASVTRKMPVAQISGDVTPEDIIYMLDSGIKGSVSPTGTNPYTYVFAAPTTASGAPRSRTLEFYDGSQCHEMNGALLESITFTGADGTDNVTFQANFIGKQIVPTTVTGALSSRSFSLLPAQSCALYVDSAAGTIGSTQISSTLIDWSLTINTGIHTKFFMDGGSVATSYGVGTMDAQLKCTFEYNSDAHTQLTNYIAGTAQLVRVKAATTAGTHYVNFDMGAVATSIEPLFGDRDGNTTLAVTYDAITDTGAFANYLKVTAVNNVSAFVANA